MSAHSGRLQHALKHLREQWDIAQDTWDDPVSREFEKLHIVPLEQTHQERDRRHGEDVRGLGEDPGSVQGGLTVTDWLEPLTWGPRRSRKPSPIAWAWRASNLNNGSWNHA